MISRSPEATAYDSWADYYDLTDADRSPFIEFYGDLVRGQTRSVLELGCGTGSITAAVARRLTFIPGDTSRRVVGVDGSQGMLAIARKREIAIEWLLGDIRSPPVEGTFDLVYCCFNTFQHLLQDADLLQAFRAAKALLAPQGVFAFDLYQPNAEYLRLTQRNRMARAVTDQDGRQLEIREDTDYDQSKRLLHLNWRLVEANAPDVGPLARTSYRLRQYLAADIHRLLTDARLEIGQIFGDFDRSPFTSTSRKQIYVCSVR